jgi:phosphoglycerate dehydrogenase-like enzyme
VADPNLVVDPVTPAPLTIWCNLPLPPPARAALAAGLRQHRLAWATNIAPSNLFTGRPDPALGEADIAFGQPEAGQCADLSRLRWIHLSSAGYAPFDTAAVKAALTARAAPLSNSSSVFAEPCAQHVLALLLADARRLREAWDDQRGAHAWPKRSIRQTSRLLRGQRVLLVGMGSIARRLGELLAPFGLAVTGVRRRPRPEDAALPGLTVVAVDQIDQHLPDADFVVNLLPGNAESRHFFAAARFAAMKPGAVFVNIGRGSTVDHDALGAALADGRLGAACLDVTDPEPLPPEHPLWSAPRCVITPHTAGGHADEPDRLVAHFLANLERYDRGLALRDRIV